MTEQGCIAHDNRNCDVNSRKINHHCESRAEPRAYARSFIEKSRSLRVVGLEGTLVGTYGLPTNRVGKERRENSKTIREKLWEWGVAISCKHYRHVIDPRQVATPSTFWMAALNLCIWLTQTKQDQYGELSLIYCFGDWLTVEFTFYSQTLFPAQIYHQNNFHWWSPDSVRVLRPQIYKYV